MVPCVGVGAVGPCVSCELRQDYDRLVRLIAEVQGLDSDHAAL
jgi:hypothetical protein